MLPTIACNLNEFLSAVFEVSLLCSSDSPDQKDVDERCRGDSEEDFKKKYYTKSALAAMQEVTDCICCVHACNRKKSSINYLF